MKLRSIALAAVLVAPASHCQAPAQRDGTTVITRPFTVQYDPLAINDIAFSYDAITRKAGLEFGRCLHGTATSEGIHVKYTRPPFTIYASSDSTLFDCDKTSDYIGPGHSHPPKPYDTCMPSAIDLVNFLEDKKARMMAIFCPSGGILTIPRPVLDDSALAYARTLPRRAGVKVTP